MKNWKNWREATLIWIAQHPKVYQEFQRLAQEYKLKGRPFSFNLLRELVRYYFPYQYPGEKYKFCNGMSPYVARQLIEDDPDLAKFIEVRATKDDCMQTEEQS